MQYRVACIMVRPARHRTAAQHTCMHGHMLLVSPCTCCCRTVTGSRSDGTRAAHHGRAMLMQENETLLAVLGKLDQQCKELEAINTQVQSQLDGSPAPRSSAQQPAALRSLQQALASVQQQLAQEKQLRQQAERELQVTGSLKGPAGSMHGESAGVLISLLKACLHT